MAKKIVCKDCKYHKQIYGFRFCEYETDNVRAIAKEENIPDWCPLEEADDE